MKDGPCHIVEVCLIEHLDAGNQNKTAFRCEEATVSFGELAGYVSGAISDLKGLGLQRGDLVFVILPDSLSFVVLFLAAIGVGSCPVPLSGSLGFEDLALLVAKFSPRAVITTPNRTESMRELGRFSSGLTVWASHSFTVAPTKDLITALVDSEFAYGLLTSGTTGIPKLIRRRHPDIVIGWNAYACGILGLCEQDIIYSTAPLCFGYGLGSGLFFPLLSGATSVLRPNGSQSFVEGLAQSRPTLFFSQPATLREIFNSPDAASLPEVRITVSAGEPLPEDLPRQWLSRFGHPILNGYGTTEVGHIFISQTLETRVEGSVGRAIPGFAIDVLDAAGSPCETGKPGILQVRGPVPMSSYYLDPQATSKTFQQDGMLTVDLASITDAGDVFVFGRVTDFCLLPSGEVLSMTELDHKLLTLPFVKDGYVAQIKSADGQTLVGLSVTVALQVGLDPQAHFREQIRAALHDELDGLVLADVAIQFVDQVPRNVHGKLIRAAIQPSWQAQFKC